MSTEFFFKNVHFECLDKQRYSLDALNRNRYRSFHNRGPTTLNERSPKLTSFVRGTADRCCCKERVRPVEHCRFSMSARYSGAVPLTHRKTCRRIFNSMRCLIGSQCSCLRIGVMWSRRGVKVILYSLELFQVFEGKSS